MKTELKKFTGILKDANESFDKVKSGKGFVVSIRKTGIYFLFNAKGNLLLSHNSFQKKSDKNIIDMVAKEIIKDAKTKIIKLKSKSYAGSE